MKSAINQCYAWIFSGNVFPHYRYTNLYILHTQYLTALFEENMYLVMAMVLDYSTYYLTKCRTDAN